LKKLITLSIIIGSLALIIWVLWLIFKPKPEVQHTYSFQITDIQTQYPVVEAQTYWADLKPDQPAAKATGRKGLATFRAYKNQQVQIRCAGYETMDVALDTIRPAEGDLIGIRTPIKLKPLEATFRIFSPIPVDYTLSWAGYVSEAEPAEPGQYRIRKVPLNVDVTICVHLGDESQWPCATYHFNSPEDELNAQISFWEEARTDGLTKKIAAVDWPSYNSKIYTTSSKADTVVLGYDKSKTEPPK
jgi:hypothetical protein